MSLHCHSFCDSFTTSFWSKTELAMPTIYRIMGCNNLAIALCCSSYFWRPKSLLWYYSCKFLAITLLLHSLASTHCKIVMLLKKNLVITFFVAVFLSILLQSIAIILLKHNKDLQRAHELRRRKRQSIHTTGRLSRTFPNRAGEWGHLFIIV